MTTKWHKIKIETSLDAYGTKVWIDDKEISGIRNVEFEHPAGELPAVVLTVFPESVEICGETNVEMLTADISTLNQLTRAQFFERSHDGKIFLTKGGLQALIAAVPNDRKLV